MPCRHASYSCSTLDQLISDCGVGGQSSYLACEDRLHVVARVTLPDLPQHYLVLVMHQDEGTPQNALVPRLIQFCSSTQ